VVLINFGRMKPDAELGDALKRGSVTGRKRCSNRARRWNKKVEKNYLH